jgi:hypothetical protein
LHNEYLVVFSFLNHLFHFSLTPTFKNCLCLKKKAKQNKQTKKTAALGSWFGMVALRNWGVCTINSYT